MVSVLMEKHLSLYDKDGTPLSFVAAVEVVVAVAAYLKSLELKTLDTYAEFQTDELVDLRKAYDDYRKCIE